jgi:hypothetical protein
MLSLAMSPTSRVCRQGWCRRFAANIARRKAGSPRLTGPAQHNGSERAVA